MTDQSFNDIRDEVLKAFQKSHFSLTDLSEHSLIDKEKVRDFLYYHGEISVRELATLMRLLDLVLRPKYGVTQNNCDSISVFPEALSKKETSQILGISAGTFSKILPELYLNGFPHLIPGIKKFPKSHVLSWIEMYGRQRSDVEKEGSLEELAEGM